MKQATTFIYRHMNHTKKAGTVKSLNHSMRLKDQAWRTLEWNEELTNCGSFILSDGQIKSLADFSDAARTKHIEKIIEDEFGQHVSTDTKKELSKYKAKLNKKIKSTVDDTLKSILQAVSEQGSGVKFEQQINALDNVKRKGQLLSMLHRYADLHGQCNGAADRRSAKLHEAFFKFPMRNKVAIEKGQAAKAMHSFYKQVAPDYKVRLLVVHDDERRQDDPAGVGLHPHIFVSTKNQKTGKRDLNQHLKIMVNQHLKLHPIEFSLSEIKNGKRVETKELIDELPSGYKGTQVFGTVMQDLFYQHLKGHFPDLDIHFTEDRERRVGQRLEKYADAEQSKADRLYNLSNYLKKENGKISLALDANGIELAKLKEEKALVANALQEAKKENERLEEENKTLRTKAQAIKDKITKSAISILTKSAEYISAIASKKEPKPFADKLLATVKKAKEDLNDNPDIQEYVINEVIELGANAEPPVDMGFATSEIRKAKPKGPRP